MSVSGNKQLSTLHAKFAPQLEKNHFAEDLDGCRALRSQQTDSGSFRTTAESAHLPQALRR